MTYPMWPLPAELLLLLLDDEGKPRVDSTARKAAVAGAAVLQLVLDGALVLAPGEPKRARLVANPGVPAQSAALAQARDRAVNRKPKDAVARIGGAPDFKGRANDIQESVLQELTAAGVVEPVEHTHLGVFRSTRWIVRRPQVASDITTGSLPPWTVPSPTPHRRPDRHRQRHRPAAQDLPPTRQEDHAAPGQADRRTGLGRRGRRSGHQGNPGRGHRLVVVAATTATT